MRRAFLTLLVVGLLVVRIGVGPAGALPEADEYCVTSAPDGAPPGGWYDGLSASYLYDANFTQGANFPDGLLPGGDIDERYVPQGLGVWHDWKGGSSTEDLFLITAYRDAMSPWVGPSSGATAYDGSSAIFAVVAGNSTPRGRALISAGHVGGIAVVGDWVYVGTETKIRAYRATSLRDSIEGPNVPNLLEYSWSIDLSSRLGEVSFLGESNGAVWAGEFVENGPGKMYKLTQAADGSLSVPVASQYTPTPMKVQGLAVTADRFIYSTSYGRDNRSNVWVVDRSETEATGAGGSVTDANSFCVRAPSMLEGAAIWDDVTPRRVVFAFESAAWKFGGDGNGSPRNRIPELHHIDLPDLLDLYTIYRAND